MSELQLSRITLCSHEKVEERNQWKGSNFRNVKKSTRNLLVYLSKSNNATICNLTVIAEFKSAEFINTGEAATLIRFALIKKTINYRGVTNNTHTIRHIKVLPFHIDSAVFIYTDNCELQTRTRVRVDVIRSTLRLHVERNLQETVMTNVT